jgi:hypothetical protein
MTRRALLADLALSGSLDDIDGKSHFSLLDNDRLFIFFTYLFPLHGETSWIMWFLSALWIISDKSFSAVTFDNSKDLVNMSSNS